MNLARSASSLLSLTLPLELPAQFDLTVPLAVLSLASPRLSGCVPPGRFDRSVLVVEHPVTGAEWAR